MKIAVDIDDVLSEWTREFLKWYNARYGTTYTYEDMVDYRWSRWMNISSKQALDDVYEFHETKEFRKLPLLSGAKEAVAELVKEHELYAVTGRQNVTAEITHQWVDKNFPGVFKGIEIVNGNNRDGSHTLTKGEVCERLGCKILIDDDTRHIESLLKHGVQAIIFNKHWNEYHRLPDSIMRANNWPEILEAIGKLEGVNK
ncbi:hypothetical protein A3K24_02370 [candidate division Kazan bacterium RIFCSPHIGHO2_01_FULL_44_14]|uniref:Nucleotidase n=1 Tax=candidate division Kazan bacterium RIFCSPLOWO2_01_FULL_45_19 TaxID=1798538 RepID=A0A1F4NRZ3_UNCK3|nr:hypothetical protein [uncultured bacterium]AQS31085.1 hypothetical protein [uncultured bacterium]OGB73662.1 MAG: hypothetical protein A3K51_02370 [candidate division Kazan bacterium RIFCSPLOWO2_01_FULL_45_19]OGB77907.1 MAG: hypothetical protein A3K24_02370 [candidate division Kazan bacterium RIFCSPHIGHO2_01_FULL_44_14]